MFGCIIIFVLSLCEIFVSGDHVLEVQDMHTISKYSCQDSWILWLFVDLHEGFFKDLSRQQSV